MVDDDPLNGPHRPPGTPSATEADPAASSGEVHGLYRDDQAGVITGVAAGLGHHTDLDPVVWRVVFAVTALAGGTGVWLYLAAWLLTRPPHGGPAMLEQLLNRRLTGRTVVALLGAGLVLATAFSLVGGFGWTTLVLAVPLILGGLVAHGRGVDLARTTRELTGWLKSAEPPPTAPRPEPTRSYYNPAQPWAATPSGPVDLALVGRQAQERTVDDTDDAENGWETAWEPPGACPDTTRTARRKRGGRHLFGFGLLALLAFTLVMFVLFGEVSVVALLEPRTAPLYLGGAVALLGALLLVGTWVGDPRGLTWLAALVTVVATAAVTVDLTESRFGEVTWRPTTAAQVGQRFELTAGQARLDLAALDMAPGQRVTVRARVGAGELEVLAPRPARLVVRGSVAAGVFLLEDEFTQAGVNLRVREVVEPTPPARHAAATEAREIPPTLVVDLVSYAGGVEVRRVAAQD